MPITDSATCFRTPIPTACLERERGSRLWFRRRYFPPLLWAVLPGREARGRRMSAMSLLQASREFFQCMEWPSSARSSLLVPRALLLLQPVHRHLPRSSFHHPLWLTAAQVQYQSLHAGREPDCRVTSDRVLGARPIGQRKAVVMGAVLI